MLLEDEDNSKPEKLLSETVLDLRVLLEENFKRKPLVLLLAVLLMRVLWEDKEKPLVLFLAVLDVSMLKLENNRKPKSLLLAVLDVRVLK